MMDYPCGKFGDCSFSHFGFIMRINTRARAAKHFAVTVIGMSNKTRCLFSRYPWDVTVFESF